jgi:hypothetical protein
VGHWAEFLVDDIAARLPADVGRDRILAAARRAGTAIETLTGQSFGWLTRKTVSIGTFGLPFVELPGLLIGSAESPVDIWPIPNPVDRERATVVQVAEVASPVERGMPVGSALRVAGNLIHATAQSGFMSRDYVLSWLGHMFPHEERTEFLRSLLDPSNHIHVPVAAGMGGGWWFQVTRRLLWVTKATEEQRLLEPLFPDGDNELRALAAVEPLLTVGRITSHPADWAMAVRIWPSVERPVAMASRWRHVAGAIREHGIPVLPLDPQSTSEEIECQLLLLAYWHKYIGADEPEIADAIAAAYPRPAERIARATGAPDRRAAAAMLFEGLLWPGFDPAMGAAAARRYVSRKATIAILNHRKTTHGGVRPWEALGVSERRYYKLLKQFAPKTGARYDVNAGVLEQIGRHLISRDQKTEQHAAAMDLLQQRGFSHAAARKWLQRHDPSQAIAATPRPRRSSNRPGLLSPPAPRRRRAWTSRGRLPAGLCAQAVRPGPVAAVCVR